MLVSHASIGRHPLGILIYSFHMPLFFFLYGLQTQPDRLAKTPWRRAIPAAVCTYLVPYFLFALLQDGACLDTAFTAQRLAGILYASHRSISASYGMAALWFLPCFFLAVLGHRLLCKAAAHRPPASGAALLAVCGTVLALVSWLTRYETGRFDGLWGWNVACNGICFMLLGYAFRPVLFRLAKLGRRIPLLLLGVGLLLLALHTAYRNQAALGGDFPYVVMAEAYYGDLAWYFVTALLGCLGTAALACALDCRALQFLGRQTLGVMLFQQIGGWGTRWLPFSLWLPTPWWNCAKACYVLIFSLALTVLAMFLCPPLVGRPWSRRWRLRRAQEQ